MYEYISVPSTAKSTVGVTECQGFCALCRSQVSRTTSTHISSGYLRRVKHARLAERQSYSYKTIRIREYPLNNHHIVQAQIISSLPLAHLGLDMLHGIPIAGLVCTA